MTRSQTWAALIVAGCGALLSVALFMEHIMGLTPCPLCVMQRLWVAAVGFVALIGLAHNPRILIYPLLTIVASVTGAGFSIRQLYLQGLPADQVPSCGPDLDYMIEVFPWTEVLTEMARGGGSCGGSDANAAVKAPADDAF